MSELTLAESMRCRHRGLQTRMVALKYDSRARRPRVTQLAEELLAHATAEQLVLYPFAEELLGVHDLSIEIEHSLDALLGVVGGIEHDADFSIAMARLTAAFERHVQEDEAGLLPMVEAFGGRDQVQQVEQAIDELERAVSVSRTDRRPGFWPEDAGEDIARKSGGWN